jgi:histidine ammonia-lyase
MKSIFEIGADFDCKELLPVAHGKVQLSLGQSTKDAIVAGRDFLLQFLKQAKEPVYGINTGFGSLCNTRISDEQLGQLQENLMMSHACGVGPAVPPHIVRLMLCLKIKSLSFGNSGVQLETVERLLDFYNHDLLPYVPEAGSLGASGDLAPLAHLCLPLIGKGSFLMDGEAVPAAKVLKEKGWLPIQLGAKEGLALLNGTQFMGAWAVYLCLQGFAIAQKANFVAAASLDGFMGRYEPFDDSLHLVRPHHGQIKTAHDMRELLRDSEIGQCPKQQVQDPYSFRCIPQVHGASLDSLKYVASVVNTEINSVTDNPILFPEEHKILSGGNFHGQPLALVLDFLAIALAEWSNISERRTYLLISGQRDLPVFLVKDAGLNSGFMIPQYAAAALVSQSKGYCMPSSVDSIVSSNGQEDHVSMGANAALKCAKVVKNTMNVLGIEWLNAAQALDLRKPLKSSEVIEKELLNFRKLVRHYDKDREMSPDMAAASSFLFGDLL